jgi:threonine synthase
MGLPIGRLIVATNENDVLDEFFKTGVYTPRNFSFQTSSPSMDISKASNLERFAFDLFERDPKVLREHWEKVESGKGFKLPLDVRMKMSEIYGFTSDKSTHTDRITTMKDFDMFHSLFIDTHTADGIFVAERVRDLDVKTIVFETASAVKFEEEVKAATGKMPPRPGKLINLEHENTRLVGIEPNLFTLKNYIEKNAQ